MFARDFELLGIVVGLIFWIQMLRHCLRHEPPRPAKLGWLGLILLAPGAGALLYFLLRVPATRA